MYDTKFECRYQRDDVFLDTDTVNDYEKTFIRDILYKEDLLNIFSIDYYNDDFDVFTEIIPQLYNRIQDSLPLIQCMKKMAAKVMSADLQTGLCILYSYDYMHVMHKCVSEYLDTALLSEENMKLLEEICMD